MKITAWRIVQARHLSIAFTGAGASEFPGRWNERGVPVVYAAGSLSLATLEMLAHLGRADALNRYLSIPVTFEESICLQVSRADLPDDWAANPAPPSTRAIGARWFADASSAVLAVPSAIIQNETNFILNPRHPDFNKIAIGEVGDFRFDPRLFTGGR